MEIDLPRIEEIQARPGRLGPVFFDHGTIRMVEPGGGPEAVQAVTEAEALRNAIPRQQGRESAARLSH